jgi:hypothetical protein
MKRRVGRLSSITRRMLIEADGRPIRVRDVLRRAYPGTQCFTWHYRSLWRARGQFAVPLRRGLLGPSPELLALIRGDRRAKRT